MRINATLATAVGAAVGLVAAGATYAATVGQAPSPRPVSAVVPQTATTTVHPTAEPTCGKGSVLKNDVCVVTIDRTTAPGEQNDSAWQSSGRTTPATGTAHDDSEHADDNGTKDHGEHADDHGDDHGEHSDHGDDHDNDQDDSAATPSTAPSTNLGNG